MRDDVGDDGTGEKRALKDALERFGLSLSGEDLRRWGALLASSEPPSPSTDDGPLLRRLEGFLRTHGFGGASVTTGAGAAR